MVYAYLKASDARTCTVRYDGACADFLIVNGVVVIELRIVCVSIHVGFCIDCYRHTYDDIDNILKLFV